MSQDFQQTRSSTHEKLADKLEAVSQGRDIKSLEPFAKAYLGMYLDLDKALLPDERVSLLADEKDLPSIWSGFDAVLKSRKLPSPEDIASRYAAGERLAEGYIALAATDRQMRNHNDSIGHVHIDDETMQALICFHYVDRNELKNRWLISVAQQQPRLYARALLRFWQTMQDCGVERYPGFRDILLKQQFNPVLQQLALPALQQIRRIHKKLLPVLMLSALRHVDHAELLQTCKDTLSDSDGLTVNQQIHWLATAYLLCPQQYETELTEFVGRTREKALPLLNFVEAVIKQSEQSQLTIDAGMLGSLLYMIAPRFRPKRDQFGRYDDNVSKISRLFDLLGQDRSPEARQAVRHLRGIRVMRLYSDFLDRAEQMQSGTARS